MKNNQVYLDPTNVDQSMQQLTRFYKLDEATLGMMRRVVANYPRPVILYVDEANAPLYAHSILDDLFTFNTQTGELVLFSADPMTFMDALIEMWMFIAGFETLMGDDDYWKVEFAIGAWKPVKNKIKTRLGIPINNQLLAMVGLPPEPNEAPLEDPYPFKTLVSQFNLVSFSQMVRLAGRQNVRVNFPQGTDFRVTEVYFKMRRSMQAVAEGLDIQDVQLFNQRLHTELDQLVERYKPHKLPIPLGWQNSGQDQDAASGEMGKSSDDKDDQENNNVGLMLGPPKDEPDYGQLPTFQKKSDRLVYDDSLDNIDDIDSRLENGPFGRFIDSLFDD